MRDMQATADGLRSAIERSGYYPGLVADAVSSALGSEAVVSFFVHHDALFDPAMEVRRHMSVLVLTPTRLIYSHTDENPAEDPPARPQAETSTEAVGFSRISSVAVTRVVSDPASYVPGVTTPSEVVLTIGWNVLSHVELEPGPLRGRELRGGSRLQRDHYRGRPRAAGQRGGRRRGSGTAGAGVCQRAGGGDRSPRPVMDGLMPAEPAVAPVLPRYGERSLPDLASSLLASLGVPGEQNVLGLPPAARICLLVVDGLGWELLRDHPAAAPFLSELAVNAAPLTAGFPATTVTSLGSLGTGRPPASTGCSAIRSRCRGRASC